MKKNKILSFEEWCRQHGYLHWYRQEPYYLKNGEDYSTEQLRALYREYWRRHASFLSQLVRSIRSVSRETSLALAIMEVGYLVAVFFGKLPILYLVVIPVTYTLILFFIIKYRKRW